MAKRKGMSMEEKRETMLNLFHETVSPGRRRRSALASSLLS
jgi:hypothetical protein